MDANSGETRARGAFEGEPVPAQREPPEVGVAGPARCRCSCMVQADHAEVSRGAALILVANEASVEMGGSVVAVAKNLSVRRGGSQWMLAEEARLEQAGAGILVARRVEAAETRVGVLLAGSVEGNVHTLLDTASAVRFGAAFGATLGFLLLLRRLLAR